MVSNQLDIDTTFTQFTPPVNECVFSRYDSTHGQYKGEVSTAGGKLIVDGHAITVFSERDPTAIPWGSVGAKYDLVIN